MTQKLYIYDHFLDAITNKEIDIKEDDIKIMLVSSAYTPNKSTDNFKSNVNGEVSGTGYTQGGITLQNVRFDISNGIGVFKADNPRWLDLDIDNLRYAVIYDNTPFAQTSNLDESRTLIAYIDYGEPLSVINAELEVIWNKEGIIKFTIS